MRIFKSSLKWNLEALLLALSVPLAFSGCEKFGNKSVTELHGYDLISGYYASLPQAITFSAKIGTTPDRTQAGTINQIPDFLKLVMGNPTELKYYDPIKGHGAILSRTDGNLGFMTNVDDKTGTFGSSSTATANISGCTLVQEIDNLGAFNQIPSEVNGVKARGRLSLTYSIKYSLVGPDTVCDPVRTRFKTCYVDGVGCAADTQSIFYPNFVYEMFDPTVNASVITGAEIGSFREISYQARYE